MKASTALDEKDLLIRLRDGDYVAFDQLYLQYAKGIFLKIKRLVLNQEVAKELHQDVFLKIWEHRDKLDPEIPFQAIALQNAKNLSINYYWKAARDTRMKEYLITTVSELYDHLEDLINYQATNEALLAAIAKLPPKRQLVFTRCKLEGKSYEMVAAELGVSLGTIKDHMAKAIPFIKNELINSDSAALYLLLAAALFH